MAGLSLKPGASDSHSTCLPAAAPVLSSEQRLGGSTPGRWPGPKASSGARTQMGLEDAKNFLAWPGEGMVGSRERTSGKEERPGLGGFEAAPKRLELHCGCHRNRVMARELRGWWIVGGGNPRPGTG